MITQYAMLLWTCSMGWSAGSIPVIGDFLARIWDQCQPSILRIKVLNTYNACKRYDWYFKRNIIKLFRSKISYFKQIFLCLCSTILAYLVYEIFSCGKFTLTLCLMWNPLSDFQYSLFIKQSTKWNSQMEKLFSYKSLCMTDKML